MTKEEKFYLELGKRLRKARIKCELTQEDLANLLFLNRTSVTNMEKGKQRILAHTLVELSGILNVSLDELLPKKEPKPQELKIKDYLPKDTAPEERDFLKSALNKLRKV